LPDMNFRTRDFVFAPFFGVPAATITGLPRLARLAGAAVVPCPTRMLPGGQGYVVEIGEPWQDYPSGDVEADVCRMNAWIESVVRTMPEQYYWVHRRFKKRPQGEKKLYCRVAAASRTPRRSAAPRRDAVSGSGTAAIAR